MATKEIDEFPQLAIVTGTQIIHTKDTDSSDSIMTVQQVIDLVPVPPTVDAFDPESNPIVTPTASDLFVLLDNNTGNTEGTATVAKIQTLLGLVSATSNFATNGFFDIGGLELRWGTYVSNTDGLQTVAFFKTFTTQCFGVYLNAQLADSQHPILAASFDTDEFTSNRTNLIDGDVTVTYFALGF